jgi:hypothetical protein
MLSNLRHPLIVSLIGAIVAGGFALAPFVYQYVVQERNTIEFATTKSPPIRTADGDKQIYLLSIQNTGSNLIEDVFVQADFIDGAISDISHEYVAGATSNHEIANNIYQNRISTLNPGETFSVSFLIQQHKADINPEISIRAKGIPSSNVTRKVMPKDETIGEIINLALLSTAAVFVSVLTMFWMLTRRVRRTFNIPVHKRLAMINFIISANDLNDSLERYPNRRNRLGIHNVGLM